MNPRIQELANEAAKFSAIMALPTGESGDKLFVEKFALLIVEECANVADENYIHRGSRTCGLAIRLHFGVEE